MRTIKPMSVSLKPFQENAVEQIVSTVTGFLDHEGFGELLVLQAPTGSGKTLMMARAIETLTRELNDQDLCFLWLSIGSGNLEEQSAQKLRDYFGATPKVSLLAEEFGGSRDSIDRNEVVVANWEKLRSQNREGEWRAIVMRDGEKINFREVLEKTHSNNRSIILIIDESHKSAVTERAQEIRDVISADIVIEMSATPLNRLTADDVQEGRGFKIRINPNDVIEQGLIKKELIINEGIDEIDEDEADSQGVVLEAAYRKRIELKKSFEKDNTSINPLVLIQIPNRDEGEHKKQAVVDFLSRRGISEANGKLAFWLSEKKSDTLKWIAEPDNTIEFLIFKQAIDTGWDCPRAHVLVKFRHSESPMFEIQTVGRILRMPEAKHYKNEVLNIGYIFTNLQEIHVKREEYNPNIILSLSAHRIATYKPVRLQSYFRSRVDYGDITSSFTPVFLEAAQKFFGLKGSLAAQNKKFVEKKGVSLDIKKYQQEIIANTTIQAKSFDQIQGTIKPEDRVKLEIAGNDLQSLFEKVLAENLGGFRNVKRSLPNVRTAMYMFFRKYLGSEQWPEQLLLIQKIVVHNGNRAIFERLLAESIETYKNVKRVEVRERLEESEKWYEYELPKVRYYNEHSDEKVRVASYVFEPCYLSVNRSIPEKQFEDFLQANAKKITWWCKNGEGRDEFLGIKYQYQDDIATFYPDYIVQLRDGRVGIFEVKDQHDQDGATRTKAKAEALQVIMPKMPNDNVFGGIVILQNRAWKLNNNRKYNWSKVERGDWADWDTLEI